MKDLTEAEVLAVVSELIRVHASFLVIATAGDRFNLRVEPDGREAATRKLEQTRQVVGLIDSRMVELFGNTGLK